MLPSMVYAAAVIAAANLSAGNAEDWKEPAAVDPVKAEAIIRNREPHGIFEPLDELARVDGSASKAVEGLPHQASVGVDTVISIPHRS